MSAVLAIDQGTSGTKAVVVDDDGQVLAVEEDEVRPDYLGGDAVEVDPAAIWESVLATGRRALGQTSEPISAVALANQGETVLAWDRSTGKPLTKALVWQDGRSRSVTERLADHKGLIAARTGLVLDPYFSAPKMRWIRENWTREGVVTTTDTWLVHQLCGAFVTDASTASRSAVMSIDDVAWDPELLEIFGLQDEELPAIVSGDEVVGTTAAFGGDVPVTGLVVDQQAALLAQACLNAGMAKCTYGTGAFLLANVGDTAVRSTSGLTTSVAWRLRGQTPYCVDGQVYTAASAVRWLIDVGLIGSAGELDRVAEADTGGVTCVPTFAGAAAPWWSSDASASFTGLTLGTTSGQLVRAVLEGIAAQVAVTMSAVASDFGNPMSVLRVDGGLTRSETLMQIQADIAQMPVELYPGAHATALGVGAAAHLALDGSLSIADAVGGWQPERVFEPQWSPQRAEEFRSDWVHTLETLLPEGKTQ